MDEFYQNRQSLRSTFDTTKQTNNDHQTPLLETLKSLQTIVDDKQTIVGSTGSQTVSGGEFEHFLFKGSAELANHPPQNDFVVQDRNNVDKRRKQYKMEIDTKEDEEDDEAIPPIFDGSIANATPRGIPSAGAGRGTALHLACALDSPFALAVVLLMGGDATFRHTGFQRNLVHEAACADSPDCLRLLLELGSQYQKKHKDFKDAYGIFSWRIPTKDDTLRTPFVALLQVMLDMAHQIENGNLDDLDAARHLLSTHHLTESNKVAIASLCSIESDPIENHRSIFSSPLTSPGVDGHGNTPLHWASFKNSTSCVSILIEYNADPNMKAEPSGWTPLHDAAYSNAAESVQLLVLAGADVNTKANSGATPLCFAAQEDAPEAAELLLKAGADPTVRCCGQSNHVYGNTTLSQHSRFSGYTPLHYCAHYNARRAVRVLLDHANKTEGAAETLLEIKDLHSKLPIHIAVARGSCDVFRELLHYGARIDVLNCHDDANRHGTTGQPATTSSPARPVLMDNDASSPTAISPVSSPELRSLIPSEPVRSSKPWNCLTQRSIDECRALINQVEANWSPARHTLFHPADRRAVLELLRVGKRLEQMGTGIFLELWPLVLSFCGRGWFISGGCVQDESPALIATHSASQRNSQGNEERNHHSDEEFTQFRLDD